MAGTVTNVLGPKEFGWVHSLGLSYLTTLDRDFKSEHGLCTWWVSALGLRTDGWCWWCMMILDGRRLMQVAGSSKSNAGRWTTWLLTKTHHTDMSNPEVPSRKRRSGDLGEAIPLWSIGDKVWKSWEVFMRRRWGGSRSDWLALSCFAMWWDVGSLQLVTA